MHLRARDYSPGTGRFTSRDTVQPNAPGSQGWNPYASAANNPVTYTDPSGQTIQLVAWAMMSGDALSWGLSLAGTDSVFTGLAAALSSPYVLIALILLVVVYVAAEHHWCDQHGVGEACGPAFARALGNGVFELLRQLLHITVAGTVAIACTPMAKNASPWFSIIDFVASCPTLPKPKDGDENCVAKAAGEAAKNAAEDAVANGGDPGAVFGGLPGDAIAGAGAYINCAKGKKGTSNDGSDRPDGKCYPIDNDWFFKKLTGFLGKPAEDWQDLMDQAESMKADYGIPPDGRACIDKNGNVFADFGRGAYEHLGKVY